MISVQQLASGEFAVIDGMHRVTALQQLLADGHQGIDFDHVTHPTLTWSRLFILL